MHLKRWISGLVLAPILILFTLYAPPWLFTLFILALIFIGLQEFYALAVPEIPSRDKTAGILLSPAAALGILLPRGPLFPRRCHRVDFFPFYPSDRIAGPL